MKDIDVHRLIEQQEPEAKERMWQRIKAELNLPDAPQPAPVSAKPKQWKKWTAIAAALVCVITLSIVLPLTLGGEKVRYCTATQYVVKDLGQTLKDYSAAHDNNLLYVDWYDVAEDSTAEYGHITDNENDIVFFKEWFINGETGEELTLSSTDNKTRVDIFNTFYEDSGNADTNIKGNIMHWRVSEMRTLATFQYNKNIYYLELNVGNAQERLTEIIEGMLP